MIIVGAGAASSADPLSFLKNILPMIELYLAHSAS